MFSEFFSWIDDRLGLSEIRRALFARSHSGKADLAGIFFTAFVFICFIQFITGLCLALYYVPDADHAHTTVAWIQKEVTGGAMIRGLHYWSTSMMFVLLALYLSNIFLRRLEKKPGELIWILGACLVLVSLGFAITGGLLPWDQNAFFSTRVLLGGTKPGTLTLSRFYALHSIVLPGFAVLLIVLQILARRKSASNRESSSYGAFLGVGAFAVVAALATMRPPALEPLANPLDLQYWAHPSWFLLPLFQFLKFVDGRAGYLAEIAGIIVLGVLLAVPFFQRKVATASLILMLAASAALFLLAKRDEAVPDARGKLDRQAFLAAELARRPFQPDPIGSTVALVRDRIPPVPQQFAACAECHGDLGGGGMIGPDLINVARKYDTPERLEAMLLDPQAHGVAAGQMPRFTDDRMPARERKALIQYLTGLSRN